MTPASLLFNTQKRKNMKDRLGIIYNMKRRRQREGERESEGKREREREA